jgi:hypothetical protein
MLVLTWAPADAPPTVLRRPPGWDVPVQCDLCGVPAVLKADPVLRGKAARLAVRSGVGLAAALARLAERARPLAAE